MEKSNPVPPDPPPAAPAGVTDEIIESEIQVHWTARLMRPVRRLYEWVLHWAETRYGGTALAAVAFSEALWFPIPADPLLVALCLGRPKRSFWYAINCTFWSTFGAMLALLAGSLIGEERVLAGMAWLDVHLEWLPSFLHVNLRQWTQLALDLIRQGGFWGIAAAALAAPIPYKVVGWAAGIAGVNWLTFLAATVIFRKFRYAVIAVLIYFYGNRAKTFIDKYFNWVCTGLVVVLVLVLVLVKYRQYVARLWGG